MDLQDPIFNGILDLRMTKSACQLVRMAEHAYKAFVIAPQGGLEGTACRVRFFFLVTY